MKDIDIHIVDFDSEYRKASVELRYQVLRKPLGLKYTPRQLAEEINEVHIVAVLQHQVVGVLLLKVINRQVLKMRQVAVRPDLQQSGIGRQLVVFSEDYACRNGYTSIELHARDTAKAFYLKLGYTVVGDAFEEVGIKHYKMTKRLSSFQ